MKNPGIRLLWALGVTLTLIAACMPKMVPAQSVTTVSAPFTLTVPGRGPVLNLGQGQNTCSITIYTGTAFSVTAQSASDGPNNPSVWSTATGIGTSGVITLTGTSGGTLSPGFGNTNFSFIWTGTGPLTGVESCSVGGGSGGGGGGGGGVVTQSSGANLHTNVDNFPASQTVNIGATPLPVSTPPPTTTVGVNNFPASQVVSQTTGTNLHTTVDNATPSTPYPNNGGVAPTAAPAVVSEIVCPFNTSLPSATTGQVIGAQCDSSGRLITSNGGVAQPVSGTVTVTQGTGTNLHTVCDSGCSGGTALSSYGSYFDSFTTTSTQLLIQAAAAKSTYVTSMALVASGTETVTFEYGTQATTPCDTGTTVMVQYLMSTSAGIALSGPLVFIVGPTGTQNKQLCMVTSAAVQTGVWGTFIQQ